MALGCSFCGDPDAPARQVPAPVPMTDIYCDDCYGKCRTYYLEFFKEPHRQQVKRRVEVLKKMLIDCDLGLTCDISEEQRQYFLQAKQQIESDIESYLPENLEKTLSRIYGK